MVQGGGQYSAPRGGPVDMLMHLFYHEDSSGVCDDCGVVPPPLPTLMVERRCATTTVVRPMIMRFRASCTMRSDSVSCSRGGGWVSRVASGGRVIWNRGCPFYLSDL